MIPEASEKDITQMIASRAERGYQLYLRARQLITKTGPETYTVPASGDGTYTVHYGGKVEDCECTDFEVHRDEISCKHLTAVALLFAKRRRGRVNYIGHMVEDPETGEEVEVFERVGRR
jgi:hypothetical protein